MRVALSPRKLLRRASPAWAWHAARPVEIAILGLAARTLTETPTFPAAPSASGTAPPARPRAADGGRRGAHGDCASRPDLTGAREGGGRGAGRSERLEDMAGTAAAG